MLKNLSKGQWALVIFNITYVAVFAAYYISIKNFEFLWYVAVLVFFFILILTTIRRSKFDLLILWGLSIWGFMHMTGGGVVVDGNVLYGFELFHISGEGESFILKFDQLVHFYGFAVATLVVHHLIRPYLKESTNWKVVYPILIAAGMGLGALNEIVEFIAVVVFPDTGVGGYYNTSLDLVFNMLGAVTAVIFIHFRRHRSREK